MRIVPVLDVLEGVIVHGVAGRRDQYRPIQSPLAGSAEPLDVARAIRDRYGFSTFYVADLGGILNGQPHFEVLGDLVADGLSLWVDAGSRTLDDVGSLLSCGANSVILGLESCPGPEWLRSASQEFGTGRLIFSLDLKAGRPVHEPGWEPATPDAIARTVLEAGIRRLIVLDVSAVGTQTGVPTLGLCRAIRQLAPQAEIITGGGIRTDADLDELRQSGVDAALVATALHWGTLRRMTQYGTPGN